MKKRDIIVASFLLIILVSALVVALFYNNQSNKQIDLPSQCYTNLQPSPFLTHNQVNPFTENPSSGYVKIEIKDREFYTLLVSNTGSMRPAIPDYADMLAIKPKKEDLFVGDIISFKCNSKQILHRIINISNEIYITKGDNNADNDLMSFGCQTKFEDINGKIVGVLY